MSRREFYQWTIDHMIDVDFSRFPMVGIHTLKEWCAGLDEFLWIEEGR